MSSKHLFFTDTVLGIVLVQSQSCPAVFWEPAHISRGLGIKFFVVSLAEAEVIFLGWK